MKIGIGYRICVVSMEIGLVNNKILSICKVNGLLRFKIHKDKYYKMQSKWKYSVPNLGKDFLSLHRIFGNGILTHMTNLSQRAVFSHTLLFRV